MNLLEVLYPAALLLAAGALMVVVVHQDIQTGIMVTVGLLLLVVALLAALDPLVNWRAAMLATAAGILLVATGFLVQWRRVHRGRRLATCRRASDQVKAFVTPGN